MCNVSIGSNGDFMRFPSALDIAPTGTQRYESKEEIKFALFPKFVENKLIWLERYISIKEADKSIYGNFLEFAMLPTDSLIWLEKNRKLIDKSKKV